jgi:hypothetical protein
MEYVILGRKWYGEACVPMTQVSGSEGRALDVAHKLYRDGGMNRVTVFNQELKLVFKLDRKCHCLNCQYEIDDTLRCVECERIVPMNGFVIEEYV